MFLFLTAFICCVNSKVFTEVAGWEKEKHYDRGQFSNDAGIKYHAQNICLKKKTKWESSMTRKINCFKRTSPLNNLPSLPHTLNQNTWSTRLHTFCEPLDRLMLVFPSRDYRVEYDCCFVFSQNGPSCARKTSFSSTEVILAPADLPPACPD